MNEEDTPIWKWNKSSRFSTKSVYEFLTKEDSGKHFKHIWKAKIPYKIKIFMWLVENNAILTKDNMIKRHWVGNPSTLLVISAQKMNQLTTCSSFAQLPRLPGG